MVKEKDINCIKSNPCVKQLIMFVVKSYNNNDNKLTESICHDIICYVLDHYALPTLVHFLNELPGYKELTVESYDFETDKYLEVLFYDLYNDIQFKLIKILEEKELTVIEDKVKDYIDFEAVCPNSLIR